jgi:hypothetical protein
VLADQRFGFGHGLALAAAWASIAIALIRRALEPGVIPLLASHLGPLPIPQWLALLLQEGHRLGMTFALWVTVMWLDRSISKHWQGHSPLAAVGTKASSRCCLLSSQLRAAYWIDFKN